jgi:uncharacterized glyoxalase superfamily protein PhnB
LDTPAVAAVCGPPANRPIDRSGATGTDLEAAPESRGRAARSPEKSGVAITDPLTLQCWGERTFKVLDPNGYEIWFYTNVAEPKPLVEAKLV